MEKMGIVEAITEYTNFYRALKTRTEEKRRETDSGKSPITITLGGPGIKTELESGFFNEEWRAIEKERNAFIKSITRAFLRLFKSPDKILEDFKKKTIGFPRFSAESSKIDRVSIPSNSVLNEATSGAATSSSDTQAYQALSFLTNGFIQTSALSGQVYWSPCCGTMYDQRTHRLTSECRHWQNSQMAA